MPRGELCGWYSPDPGPLTNLVVRGLFGTGLEVTVREGHLVLKPLSPLPAVQRAMRLHPDDPDDPRVFRVEVPQFGRTSRVVFSNGLRDGGAPTRLLLDLYSFQKRPGISNPRRWVNAVAATGAVSLASRAVLRR